VEEEGGKGGELGILSLLHTLSFSPAFDFNDRNESLPNHAFGRFWCWKEFFVVVVHEKIANAF
jgi:hypothetical protein